MPEFHSLALAASRLTRIETLSRAAGRALERHDTPHAQHHASTLAFHVKKLCQELQIPYLPEGS
jgi:hypothetical protein